MIYVFHRVNAKQQICVELITQHSKKRHQEALFTHHNQTDKWEGGKVIKKGDRQTGRARNKELQFSKVKLQTAVCSVPAENLSDHLLPVCGILKRVPSLPHTGFVQ